MLKLHSISLIIFSLLLCDSISMNSQILPFNGCTTGEVEYYNICCGQVVAGGYIGGTDSRARYHFTTQSQFCCGQPQLVGEIDDDCIWTKVKPSLIEALRQISPKGQILVASCSGSLIPIRPTREWTLQMPRNLGIEVSTGEKAQ